MADYKAIMTLALAGHSYSEIVAAVGCSRREIAAVIRGNQHCDPPGDGTTRWERFESDEAQLLGCPA